MNAADNKQNDKSMSKINIEAKKNSSGGLTISIMNNGKSIPITLHKTEKIHIPELIFGTLLTGSNFNDEKVNYKLQNICCKYRNFLIFILFCCFIIPFLNNYELLMIFSLFLYLFFSLSLPLSLPLFQSRLVGGTHGFGAKLTNIFSTNFTVETYNKKKQKLYSQSWTDNMFNVQAPVLTKTSDLEDFTRITFTPDLSRFGIEKETEKIEKLDKSTLKNGKKQTDKKSEKNDVIGNTIEVFRRRAFDMAATLPGVEIIFNNEI